MKRRSSALRQNVPDSVTLQKLFNKCKVEVVTLRNDDGRQDSWSHRMSISYYIGNMDLPHPNTIVHEETLGTLRKQLSERRARADSPRESYFFKVSLVKVNIM